MRHVRSHVVDEGQTAILPKLCVDDRTLERQSAPEIAEVSSHCSLGFHPAAVIRLSNQKIVALTELYPSVAIPCNNRNATSLYDVARSGGPTLPALELCLEIHGAVSIEQVWAVRRVRGIVPGLQKVQVSKVAIELHYNQLGVTLTSNDKKSIFSLCAESFGKERRITITACDQPNPEMVTLSELDRLALRKISHMAWSQERHQPRRAPRRGSQGELRYKCVQTMLVDIPNAVATLIEQGPAADDTRTSLPMTDNGAFTIHSTRLDGQMWHDSARSAIMRLGVTPACLRVSASASDLFISALLAERDSRLIGKSCSLPGVPFTTRLWGLPKDDPLITDFFEMLPQRWNFRGLKESACKTMVLLDADAPRELSLPDQEHKLLEEKIEKNVLYSHNRFSPVSLEDAHVRKILECIPFCSVVLDVKRCRVTNEILIHTANEIPESTLGDILKTHGHSVINTVAQAHAPTVIEPPARLIAQGRMTPAMLSPISDRDIRTLKVIGGAEDVGGSSLLLGNILLDCGTYPKNMQRRQNLVLRQKSQVSDIQAAFLTHGHLDHVGNSLLLASLNIPVFMHNATALVSWPLLKEQLGKATGFTVKDLESLYKKIHPVPFNYRVNLSPTVSATLVQAGHMVGSSMVVVEHTDSKGTWRAMYTGDLQSDSSIDHNRIFPPAAIVPRVDALIVEATNGMAPLAPRAELEKQLITDIQESLKQGGLVILPAIASRVPELLTLLVKYRAQINAPICVNGPALVSSIERHSYLLHLSPNLFVQSTHPEHVLAGEDRGYFCEVNQATDKKLLEDRTPRVIIASGGMGRGTSERLIRSASAKDTVIFTCYQAPGSFGCSFLNAYQAAIKKGALSSWNGPRALIQRLSGHISGDQLLEFVKETLKEGGKVVLLHGSDDEKIAVKAALTKQNHAGEIIIARAEEQINL